jgi:hypothetical protein
MRNSIPASQTLFATLRFVVAGQAFENGCQGDRPDDGGSKDL